MTASADRIEIFAPLSGYLLPFEMVFAQKLLGDGNRGTLTVEPDDNEIGNVEDTMQQEEITRAEETTHASEAAVTADGIEIRVAAGRNGEIDDKQ